MSNPHARSAPRSLRESPGPSVRPHWSGGPRTHRHSREKSLNFCQDTEIYGEGSAADEFFEVVTGMVRTCKFLKNGRRQIDAFHTQGEVFGVEAASEHGFSAEAVCDCTVISYRRHGRHGVNFGDAQMSEQMFGFAMRRVARAQNHALLLGCLSAIEKVANFLTEWAEHSPGGTDITLAMARGDIADYLGLTIETVSRTLSHLERESIIAIPSPRQIRLTNPKALQVLHS
jgi:CRP/FNR family nitrogen fixation transcriptional regulator